MMSYDCIRILNCNILRVTKDKLLGDLHSGVFVTPNADHLVLLQKDKEFFECYQKADWVVCDGRILYFCSKLMKFPLPETVSGADFFSSYYMYHRKDPDCRIFLLGARKGVGDIARQKINERVGGEIVIGNYSPPFGFEKNNDEIESTIRAINESGANVVLVGLGAPKQEKFIMAYKDHMPNVKIWMALGATIDFEAGVVARAPKWVSQIGFEWLFRIIQEPRRLTSRYLNDLIFFWYFFKQLCGLYKNPWEK